MRLYKYQISPDERTKFWNAQFLWMKVTLAGNKLRAWLCVKHVKAKKFTPLMTMIMRVELEGDNSTTELIGNREQCEVKCGPRGFTNTENFRRPNVTKN